MRFNRQESNFRQFLFWVVTLWAAVIASALIVVKTTYETRVEFNKLEILRREHNELQIVWGQYLLEESTWAAYGRIEKEAKETLLMHMPETERMIMVNPNEG